MNLKKYKQVIHKDFIQDIDFINKTIKLLSLDKNSKILDIGTGIGAMAILLAINGFDVTTGEPKFDPESDENHHHNHSHGDHNEIHHEEYSDEKWRNWGNWRDSANKLGVKHKLTYQNFNAENLPYPDKSYDGIFMYDSLQHIHNRKQAISESLRVLAPTGVLCIIEWNKTTIELENKKYGYEIEFLDPKEFINTKNVLVETHLGEFTNFYILKKKKSR